MEGVHLNIHCTRVYIKKIWNLPQFMHVSRYNLLGCKKVVRHAYKYIAWSNAQQRLMPPFRSDLQMPLSRVQIDECTSYEFESLKPPLC